MKTGLEMASDGNWTDGLGSFLYVFLRDLRIATRGDYCNSIQQRQLAGKQANAQHAIELGIKESLCQFGNFREEKRELPRCLLGGNQGGKVIILIRFNRWGLSYRKCFSAKKC